MRRSVLLVFTGFCLPICLPAQTSRSSSRAAATITGSDVARRIGIIADDSMLGRDTPSRGLELTAQYVANQFKGFTSRVLRAEFAHLKSRMPTLWSSSYFAASAGAVSAGTVHKYIETQWERPWKKEDARS